MQETYSGFDYKELGYEFVATGHGCAILSKFPAQFQPKTRGSPRFLTAEIDLKTCTVFVTCVHLYHRTEPRRMREISAIQKHLAQLFLDDQCQIWTGDFNALTKEDYDEEEWENITCVRKRNSWELPQTDLTTKV